MVYGLTLAYKRASALEKLGLCLTLLGMKTSAVIAY